MDPTKLSEWKLIGPRLIDVGHRTVIELNYTEGTSAYRSFILDHVIKHLFTAAEALYKACQMAVAQFEKLERSGVSSKGQAKALEALRAALGMIPPVDDGMLQYVISQLDKGNK